MKKSIRKYLILIVGILLAISLTVAGMRIYNYHEGDRIYSDALEMAGSDNTVSLVEEESESEPEVSSEEVSSEVVVESETESEEVESKEEVEPQKPQMTFDEMIASVNLPSLRKVNSDVVAWIAIPNTVISYPVMQADDNDYYLNHTWNKVANPMGSIFLECKVNPDFTDFNTIIYGHRMGNGTMFNGLEKYKNYNYWKNHPYVYIKNDDGLSRYKVIAAYQAEITEITYALNIQNSDTKQKFIEHSLSSSVIDTGVVPTENDRILTLVTCIRGGSTERRWVIQAVCTE